MDQYSLIPKFILQCKKWFSSPIKTFFKEGYTFGARQIWYLIIAFFLSCFGIGYLPPDPDPEPIGDPLDSFLNKESNQEAVSFCGIETKLGINMTLSTTLISIAKNKNSLNLQTGDIVYVKYRNPSTGVTYKRPFEVVVYSKSPKSDAEFFVSEEIFEEWKVDKHKKVGIIPITVATSPHSN